MSQPQSSPAGGLVRIEDSDEDDLAIAQTTRVRQRVVLDDDDDEIVEEAPKKPVVKRAVASKAKGAVQSKSTSKKKASVLEEEDLSDLSSAGEPSDEDLPDTDDDDIVNSEDDFSPGDAKRTAKRARAAPGRGAGPSIGAVKRRKAAGPAAKLPRLRGTTQSAAKDDEDEWQDFRNLKLKEDHAHRPLWVTPDGRVFLETFSPVYKQAYDFLIAIAEPQSRPETVHEYQLTVHSLYAAVSVGLTKDTIIAVLNRLSKTFLDDQLIDFIHQATQNYGKVKLVLQRNKFFVESPNPEVLRALLQDDVISRARVHAPGGAAFQVSRGHKDAAAQRMADKMVNIDLTAEPDAVLEDDDGQPEWASSKQAAVPGVNTGESAIGELSANEVDLHSFEIQGSQVEFVKQRCLPSNLNYPMLEEYDFRNDTINADIPYELKPIVKHRPYQEKGLAKMFGNGRARSGIVVLPCGAGKSLTGISAAVRIRKSCLVLVTSAVSVDQWKYQFKLWTTIQDHNIGRFTSDAKEMYPAAAGVMISTYTMIAYSGKRSAEAQRIFERICSQEWGLILLDEVHVVPAEMFRKVIGIIKSHCKLGLTATLVREDALITDLNFLIGPKLYEANWLDLTRAGHIANVQCCEVWCPMTKDFYRQYLREPAPNKRLALYVMNPNKFRACEFLVRYHETQRRDKIIVFSDNLFALKEYAIRMQRPFVYGDTSHRERTQVLSAFKHSSTVNTVFLSKVGDNSLDIPEANVLIQISSHAGSRRQEAQRLGRILRPKKDSPGQQGANEFNAFFYTLVSKDTQEMFFSTKRQRFLIDQGYSFKVVSNLLDNSDMNLQLSSHQEQLDLLAKVKANLEANAGVEGDADADAINPAGKGAMRRKTGQLSAHTGADASYQEYHKGKPSGGNLRSIIKKRTFGN